MPRLSSLAAGIAGLTLLTQPVAGQSASGQSLGFAISWLGPQHYYSEQDCGNGINDELNWRALLQKAGRSAAEVDKLIKENGPELLSAILHRGPKGEDVCAEPWKDTVSPPWKLVTGKIAYGENLDGTTDGSATATTCAHEKFTTPEGELVDNQYFRVFGCGKSQRGKGRTAFGPPYIVERMKEGVLTLLLEITGIDDMNNDPEIELTLYRGLEGMQKDSTGEVMANHTFHTRADPNLQIRMKGSIKDGVLTTVPRDIEMVMARIWMPPMMRMTNARFRVSVGEDGVLKGTLAGYRNIALEYVSAQRSKSVAERFAGMNCPGLYKAFHAMADGNRDPVTGQCSTISAIDVVEAVPAYLIHPADPKVTESTRPVRTTEAQD